MHTDVSANLDWLKKYAEEFSSNHENDLIIVAGDISDSLEVLRTTLAILKGTFGAGVAFVPGNHDLWCGKLDRGVGALCACACACDVALVLMPTGIAQVPAAGEIRWTSCKMFYVCVTNWG